MKMKLTKEQQDALVRITLATRPEEITCDDWLLLVGRYLELVAAGDPVPGELRPVVEHLDLCAECREEFETLRRALGSS